MTLLLNRLSRLSSSLVNIPTYINNRERLPDEVIDVVVKNKMVYNFISENYPETLRPKDNAEKVSQLPVVDEIDEKTFMIQELKLK